MGGSDDTYQKLLKIRKSKDLKLSNNKYLKPEVVLRYYQIIGAVHLYMVRRMVLGDGTGLGKCCVPEMKLMTKRGIVNFLDKTLWYNKTVLKEDTFYNIPNELSVASDGVKKATQIYYGGKKPTIYFKTKMGTWGQSTHNHSWKVMCEDGFIHWKKTAELKVGDYIAVGRNQNIWGAKKLDKDLAWFLGMIVGDGHYNKSEDNYFRIGVCNTHDATNIRLFNCAEKFFSIARKRTEAPRKEGYLPLTTIKESKSKDAEVFISKYGLTLGIAKTKKIPGVIKGCQKEVVCSFLQGLFDSDGSVGKEDGTVEITLASEDLIEDIHIYLLNMGIVSTKNIHRNKEYGTDYYRLTITDFISRKKFYNWIGFSVDYKKKRLRDYVYRERKSNVNYDIIPYQQDKIRKIRSVVPTGLKWAFKSQFRCLSSDKANFTYSCARKLLSFSHEEFFQKSKEYQELKEIFDKGYFFTPITEIKDGGYRDVYDLSVPDGNTYCANGMISHNTIETIAAYTTLLNKDPTQKLVVVCPSSALYQWASEFDKFCNGVTCQIVESVDTKVIRDVGGKLKNVTLTSYDSREHQLKKFEDENKNVLIFNYNTLVSDFYYLKELFSRHKIMLVFDEATSFKNPKSITHKHALEIARIPERVYGLTATAIKNNLIEIFSIYRVVVPGLFGPEIKFKKDYCLMEQIQLWKGKGKRGKTLNKIVGYKNLDYFKKNIDRFYLGRKKSEVAPDLPEIQVMEVAVNLTSQQQSLYDDALAGFLDFDKFKRDCKLFKLDSEQELEEEEQNIKYIDKLTALIYCQQICNSPHLIGIDAPSAKEEELLRILDTELADEKIVIYSRFKKMIDRLEMLITKNLKKKCTKITGDVGNEQREINKKLFNTSEDVNIILINSAAREAVNLQSSGYLLFYDLPFSYGDFLQIVGRIHRIGSTHDKIILIYLMGKNTVDEKVYKTLQIKKRLFDYILGDSAVGAIKESAEAGSTIGSIFDSMVKDATEVSKK